MEKNLDEINPPLVKNDRIVIIYMHGEDSVSTGGIMFGETKGKVIDKINQPKFKPDDPGYGYKVEFYDDEGKFISKLPIFPESDAWVYDREYYESNPEKLNENMFKNIDDLIEWGEFFQVFTKGELDKICEFLELERRTGFSNMYMEGGRFLLTGPDYIKDFIKLQSYQKQFDEEDEMVNNLLVSRSQEVRDIFIRNAMKYLENKGIDPEIPQVQKMMRRLAQNAKGYWMRNADKYIHKEIE